MSFDFFVKTAQKKELLYYFITEVFFLLAIFVTIYSFVDFRYQEYVFAGDFRLHIFKEFAGEHFLFLMSDKYSTNNFVYSSFHSIYSILQFVPYHLAITYVFFGIPLVLYFSLKFFLIKSTHFFEKINRLDVYILYSGLAFYFAVNPALFDRYVHWPILQSLAILPIFVYFSHKFFLQDRVLNRYLLLLPPLLYFGAVTPQLVIFYIVASGLVLLDYLLQHKFTPSALFGKMLMFFLCGVLVFCHTFYLIFSGYGVTKSFFESEITTDILSILSKKSSVYSAVSGTNFYDSLVDPFPLSVGFVVFLFSIFLMSRSSSVNRRIQLLFVVVLSAFVLVSGNDVFPQLFNFFDHTAIRNFFWIVKDPNMYYLLLLFPLILLFVSLFRRDRLFEKGKFVLFLGVFIFLMNFLNINFLNKEKFNQYFDFVDIPKEYMTLADELADDKGRNLWLPYDWYVQKNFTRGQTHFPTPAFWLTKNKELIDFNAEYRDFIMLFQKEIYEKKCKNIYFIDWIIATQNLNIIIDKNSVNHEILNINDIEDKAILTEQCMQSLPHVYEYKNIGNILVYRSSLDSFDDIKFYKDVQNIDNFNSFLKDNLANIVSDPNVNLEEDYSILNEAYDLNWRSSIGQAPVYRINMFSMAFAGKTDRFYYRGEAMFQRIVFLQKVVIGICVLVFLIIFFRKNRYSRDINR